jgi:UDP-N-acetyl-D-galactosamine dehydrogenase
MSKELFDLKIAVIGLGYVGLPLAVEFSKKFSVIGYDINDSRVKELKNLCDKTLEVDELKLKSVLVNNFKKKKTGLLLSSSVQLIKNCNIFIITVPTPIDKFNNPLLTPIIEATKIVGKNLTKGSIVIYESTFYPGVTEEVCVPILENISGLKHNIDFFSGYSPERINPGDKEHTITKIKKITSGSTIYSAILIDNLYKSIITAGTFKAKSIKVAEAAKVIENAQRDINIAFVNELSKIFNLIGINTNDVLEAASTKWNFLKFQPGLVGGHCIGVDPYYLAQKAQELGYHPEIILAGRRVNDGMGKHVASETIKLMTKKGIKINKAKVLIMGLTFKENCPDFRNTKVIDIIEELKSFGLEIVIVDPWVDAIEVKKEYFIKIYKEIPKNDLYDAVVVAVAHDKFKFLNIVKYLKKVSVLYDVKRLFDNKIIDGSL